MNLVCPSCQEPLSIPEQYAGQLMKCPACSGHFTVPSPEVIERAPIAESAADAPPDLGSLSPDVGDVNLSGGTVSPDGGLSGASSAAPDLVGNFIVPDAPDGAGIDDILKLACPFCSRPLAIQAAYAGQRMRCPYCSGAVIATDGADASPGDGLAAMEPPSEAEPPEEVTIFGETATQGESLIEQRDRREREYAEALERQRQYMHQVDEEIREMRRQREAASAVVEPDPVDAPDYGDVEGHLLGPESYGEEEMEARRQANARNREIASANRQRSNLQDREAGLLSSLEGARGAREGRNAQRRGSARERLFNRIPGASTFNSGMSLSKDLFEALGYGDESETDREQEMVTELQQIRSLLEEMVREAVNDGASVGERNIGEKDDRHPWESVSNPPVQVEGGGGGGGGSRRRGGPLRPPVHVPSAEEARRGGGGRISSALRYILGAMGGAGS